MHQLKTYKLILSVAAMLFLAKPFLGFSVYEQLQDKAQENTLLVKVFAKRKPEFMEEAIARSAVFQAMLKEKADIFILTIGALLLSIFPLFNIFDNIFGRRRNREIQDIAAIDPIYLLTCRLTI
ncbi:hypothetical protein [Mucilaginibacter sp. PAMB04168]|uniref:hypothetical protein n=1 Tax=Mucilaginibacter sp. PAMB04168 TaxID=3138567 RepID=UPI0031F630A6